MAKHNPAPQSATPQAKVRTIQSIPVEVKDDLFALGLLQCRLHEMLTAVEYRQNNIIQKLTGRKMDAALMRDLVAEGNRRAAKIQRGAAVRP